MKIERQTSKAPGRKERDGDMTLRKKAFLRVVLPALLLIVAICAVASVLEVRHERQHTLDTFRTHVQGRAEEAERLMLWDDRVSLHKILLRLQESHPAVLIAFMEKDNLPFVSPHGQGVPAALLGWMNPETDEVVVRRFRDEHGVVFHDIAAPVGIKEDILLSTLRPDPVPPFLHVVLRQDAVSERAGGVLIGIAVLGVAASLLVIPVAMAVAGWTTCEVDQLTGKLREHGEQLEHLVEERTATLREYAQMVEATTDIMAFVGSDLTYRAVNESYLAAYDKTREEIVGHTVAEIVGSDVFESSVKAHFNRCLAGETFNYQIWFEIAGSGLRYFDLACHPYRESGGPVSGVVVSARDITPLRRTQEALAEKTTLLDNILSSASDVAIVTTDLEFRITYYNPTAERLFGSTSAEVVGKTAMELHGPDQLKPEQFERAIEIVRDQGEYHYSLTQETGDGPRHLESRVEGIRNSDGELVGYSLFSRDITERKLTELSLLEARAELKHTIDAVPSIIARADVRTGYFTHCNPAFTRILGFSAEELLARPFVGFIHPDDRQKTINEADGQLSGRTTGSFENRYCCKDGSYQWLEWSVTAADEQGVVHATATDVTERKRAEEAIRLRERYLAALNDVAETLLAPSDAVPFQEFVDRIGPASRAGRVYVFMNHRGPGGALMMSVVAEWCAKGITSEIENPLLQDMSVDEWLPHWRENLQRHELVTGRVADFPDKQRGILDSLGVLTIMHIPINIDTEFIGFIGFADCVSGREREVIEQIFLRTAASDLAQAIRRARSQEQVRRYADQLEDLVDARTAEIRRLERQRSEMEKLAATGRMAAGIAHEINNPLAGIKNAFELVKVGVPEDHKHYAFVGMIEKEIDRIALIVSQMGLLYQPAAGMRRHRPLRPILEDISRMFEARIRHRRLTLSVDIEDDLPDVRIVDNHLRQVVYNVLVNATQAAPVGSEVSLSCKQVRETIHIEIADRGDGIAEDILPRIFEPFFTTKIEDGEGGMGLGLAVSDSMTRAMGGKLMVRTTVGKGSTFIIEFPIDGVNAPIQQEGGDHE